MSVDCEAGAGEWVCALLDWTICGYTEHEQCVGTEANRSVGFRVDPKRRHCLPTTTEHLLLMERRAVAILLQETACQSGIGNWTSTQATDSIDSFLYYLC